jgi:hypothetical protein
MTRLLTKGISCLLLGVAVTSDAHAQAYFCSKPSAPYCIDAYGTFESERTYRNCRSEVEHYLSQMDDYVTCLGREVDDARTEANGTIDRFNCKAQGNRFCP